MELKDLDFAGMTKEDKIAYLRAKIKGEIQVEPPVEALSERDLGIFIRTINAVGIDEWEVMARFDLASIEDLTEKQYAIFLHELNGSECLWN